MLASILFQFSQLDQFLLQPLHSTLFPYPILTSIHAARVSLAYRSIVENTRKSEREEYEKNGEKGEKPGRTWTMDLVGFLIMAWGGSFISNYLVHSTPPQLVTISPFLQYSAIHIFLSLLFQVLPAPAASFLDTFLPILDGSTRAGAVINGLTLSSRVSPSPLALSTSSPNSARLENSLTSSSLILPLILGTISASFGSQLAFTLSVFSSDWSFKTPPILKSRNLLTSIDVLSPLLAAFSHGLLNSYHPIYVRSRVLLGLSDGGIVLGLTGARALVSLIISVAFAWRALCLHWMGDSLSIYQGKNSVNQEKSSVNSRGKIGTNGNGAKIETRPPKRN